jgi:hypothetical protein
MLQISNSTAIAPGQPEGDKALRLAAEVSAQATDHTLSQAGMFVLGDANSGPPLTRTWCSGICCR